MAQRNWKPMLCKKLSHDKAQRMLEASPDEFIIEQKYDGVRASICNGRLYNRRGKDITHKFPEFIGIEHIKGEYDGEVIARTEEFNDTASRIHTKDKFKIKLLAKTKPAKFVCFDCVDPGKLQDNGLRRYLADQSLKHRRHVMETELEWRSITPWFELAPQLHGSKFDEAWQDIIDNEREGLIIKNTSSIYEFGRRSPSWYKVKAWEETIATFTTYEEHPKGITIETSDGRRVVVNGEQADDVRKEFTKHGSIEAEIQYLPQKDSNAWRFPSFRRLKIQK